jgi:hypothetical protein
VEQAVSAFEKAYVARDLGSLDKQFPRRICARQSRNIRCTGKLTILMEHSLRQDDRIEYISFNSFAAAEKWLRKSESGSGDQIYPFRSLKPRQACKKGLCTYNFKDGIIHNTLYLKSIKYGMINYHDADDYYIREIHLLHGD